MDENQVVESRRQIIKNNDFPFLLTREWALSIYVKYDFFLAFVGWTS